MIEKRFSSKTVENLEQDTASRARMREKHGELFPVGTKYMFSMKTWYVVDRRVEQGTEFRRIMNNFGQEELVTVDTLLKDMEQGGDGFMFIEPTESEVMMMKATSQGLSNG